MKPAEYETYDGLGLAELLRDRQVSAEELMRCAVQLAEERAPAVNAICYPRYEDAILLARRAEPRGTFGALPFLLKDSGLASIFLPMSIGSRLFAGTISSADATLTKRFLADGFLPFARTTVPEFCMAPTTEAVQYGGPTRNPWELTRSPGGSSGGAAAAVALGIVPIAHGSDGGGSIRIPASCCGIFGLKPSRGLVPHGPLRGEGWGGLASDGVLTRTVRDSAAALDGIAGMEQGAPYAAPPRPRSYLDLLDAPFERPLRIQHWISGWSNIPIASECRAATERAAELLRDLGHDVVETLPPPLKYDSFIDAIIEVMAANVAVTVNGHLRQKPDTAFEQKLEPALLDAYHIGSALSAERYVLAINRFHATGRQLSAYMAGHDAILTPTLTQPPVKLGTISTATDFRSFRRQAGRYTTFLAVFNAAGLPAANLPLHRTAENLPIGVQLVGQFGEEVTILRLAAQLEAIAPWHNQQPF